MAKQQQTSTPVIRNKKASFKFELLDQYECGIALQGTEVKSLRAGQASLDEAYARLQGEEIWLIGCSITPYSHGSDMNHEPTRPRKLLLHKAEIRKIIPRLQQRGQTLVPVRLFFNQRGLCKVIIALARGKTHGDRRESLRKKTQQREMDRATRRH